MRGAYGNDHASVVKLWEVAPGWNLLAKGAITMSSSDLRMSALVLLRHRENIGRLIRGEEPPFGGAKTEHA